MASTNPSRAPRIGAVRLGDGPRLVLAVSADSVRLRAAAALGVSVIELRVDGLRHPQPARARQVVQALRRYGLPIIGTVRSQREGGLARLPDAQRALLYASISPWVDAIDVELASAVRLETTLAMARQLGVTIILSHHDFTATPSLRGLERLVDRAAAAGADIIKIAATARSSDDVVRLLALTAAHRNRHLVTIAMGPLGSISRLVFPLAGSLLTYTNLTPAHGQVPLEDFVEHLRWYYPGFRKAVRAQPSAVSSLRRRGKRNMPTAQC